MGCCRHADGEKDERQPKLRDTEHIRDSETSVDTGGICPFGMNFCLYLQMGDAVDLQAKQVSN